jgi:hypothetical protein
MTPIRTLAAALFLQSFALILYELLLTRLFAVTLFADFAHLALALALLGIGVGAMAQHLRPSLVPERGLERRLGALALLQAVFTLVAVLAAVQFPVLRELETPPVTYQDRSHIKDDLLDPVWFAALLPILAMPFFAAGLTFAGTFQRRKEQIGFLYGADLIGAAAGAVVFLPILGWLAGPDAAFVVLAACGAAALLLLDGTVGRVLAGAFTVGSVVAVGFAAQGDLLPIRQAAGYSEDQLVYTEWTPLTRLAVHRDRRGDYILLDNSSASEILTTVGRRQAMAQAANRAFVYHLHDPATARVAILAASAGPEVGAAQSLGFENIDAIDIASEIFDIVADRYPDSPVNPYLLGNTRRIHSDGRAAILRATEPYDVIQMVHANLWSSAGLLSNAWSPALLETREAFETYLDHLSEDGTISFGRGSQSDDLFRAAVAALRARGVTAPHRHIAYLEGESRLLLVKKHPWTEADFARLQAALLAFPQEKIDVSPMDEEASKRFRDIVGRMPAMTDDHPYNDGPKLVGSSLAGALQQATGEDQEPLAALYRSIVLQCAFVLAAGLVFIGVPLVFRGRSELAGVSEVGSGLLYVGCLGYGYLSVETVLIHALVLFVGHPTYAITSVVLSMLLFSGVGSLWAARPPDARLALWLRRTLLATIALGAFQAFVLTPLLYEYALELPLAARMAVTGLMLAPLAFAMGTAFPLAVRLLPARAAPILPWAWAINGWMSVVGSLSTVLIARLWGYTPAFAVALVAYAVAAALGPRLAAVGVAKTAVPEGLPQAG